MQRKCARCRITPRQALLELARRAIKNSNAVIVHLCPICFEKEVAEDKRAKEKEDREWS